MKVVSTIDSYKFHFRVEGDEKVKAAVVEMWTDSPDFKKFRGSVKLHDGFRNFSETKLEIECSNNSEKLKKMARKAVEDTLMDYNSKIEQAEKFAGAIGYGRQFGKNAE